MAGGTISGSRYLSMLVGSRLPPGSAALTFLGTQTSGIASPTPAATPALSNCRRVSPALPLDRRSDFENLRLPLTMHLAFHA